MLVHFTDTPRGSLESPYSPQTEREIAMAGQWGLDANGQGNGATLIKWLQGDKDPFYSAYGKDLAKFAESMGRVNVRVTDADVPYVRVQPDGSVLFTMTKGILNSNNPYLQAHVVAHEMSTGCRSWRWTIQPMHLVQQVEACVPG
jgi:hypothetical protein